MKGPHPAHSIITVLLAALMFASAVILAHPSTARADTDITPWSRPATIATGLRDAAQPALASTPDGTAHALWESEGTIYHAARRANAGWTAPQRVATGISPALVVDSTGVLHAVFANQFLGNFDIFHVTYRQDAWSLPTNVSRTYGVSMSPTLAAGSDGALHAAWMDNSPGYWTVFAGSWRSSSFWSSNAVPHARGQSPAIAVSPQNVIFVAWQDRVPSQTTPNGVFDIYSSQRIGGSWTLAINISNQPTFDSIGADVSVTSNGYGHLTWVDGGQTVRYAYGKGYYWVTPQTVVMAGAAARGPQIAAANGTRLHIAWDEGEMVRVTRSDGQGWMKPEVIPASTGTLKDVELAPTMTGGVMVSWVHALQPGNFNIYESRQEIDWAAHIWLPSAAR